MRSTIAALVLLTASTWTAAPAWAQVAERARAAENSAACDEILNVWEQRSAGRGSLKFSYTREDDAPGWVKRDVFQGMAYWQAPGSFCLHLKKLTPPKGREADDADFNDDERIVVTESEFRQYAFDARSIFVFPTTANPAQKSKRAVAAWFLALPKGLLRACSSFDAQLPFLFNVKADDVKARYAMTLMKQNATSHLIAIEPKCTEDKEMFSKAYVILNKQTFLPEQIKFIDAFAKSSQLYKFVGVVENGKIDPRFFEPSTPLG